MLRISTLCLALLLLFDSGLLNPVTADISKNAQLYLANSIGMQASVTPTDLNGYTAQLTQRERLLAQRENDVAAREIKVSTENGFAGSTNYSTYIMSALLFILLVLVLMNYILDYMRIRKQPMLNDYEKMA